MTADIKSILWTRYSQSSSGFCLSFPLCLRCVWVCVQPVCMCALEGYTGTVTSLRTSCSLENHPLLLPVTPPPCPLWVDNMQPLYATCPSARLHLREPPSPSWDLPLAAFVWILLSLSHPFSLPPRSSLCSLRCPLQTQTHRKTHTYRLVIASVSYFLHLPPGTKSLLPAGAASTSPLSLALSLALLPSSHLQPGRQQTRVTTRPPFWW